MESKPKRTKVAGREKGTPNKVTASAKENILAVFNRLEGTAGMAKWARKHQTEFYKLYGRLIPVESHVSGSLGTYEAQPIPVEHRNTDSVASPTRPATDGDPA